MMLGDFIAFCWNPILNTTIAEGTSPAYNHSITIPHVVICFKMNEIEFWILVSFTRFSLGGCLYEWREINNALYAYWLFPYLEHSLLMTAHVSKVTLIFGRNGMPGWGYG